MKYTFEPLPQGRPRAPFVARQARIKASSDNNQTRRLGSATITRETRVIDLATRPEILSKDDTQLQKRLSAPLSFDAPRLASSRPCDRSAQGKPVLATVLHIRRFFALPVSHVLDDNRLPACCVLSHVQRGRDRHELHLLIARRRANVDKRSVAVASEASRVSKSRCRIVKYEILYY